MTSFSATYEVPPSVLQSDYQHVHHAEILRYLERGRLDFLTTIGCPHDDFLRQGLFLVISRIDVQYKREVRAGEITVICSRVELDSKKISIFQELINEKGKLAVQAQVESQLLSREVGRAIFPPQEFVRALDAIRGQ